MDDDTFFEALWNTYPRDLCRKKPGSRKVARQSFDKLKADDKLKDEIMIGLREWMRACRQEAKIGQTDRWPFLSTWLNQARWEMDQIPQSEDLKDKAVCECGRPCKINQWCDECWDASQPPRWQDRAVQITGEHGHEAAYNSLARKFGRLEVKNGSVTRINVGAT